MAKEADNGANLDFGTELWQAADALSSNMGAAESKRLVLGLVFLKYLSDVFEEHRAALEGTPTRTADPEDPGEYRSVNVSWVPKEARWSRLKANAKLPKIGEIVDGAMLAVGRGNPSLESVLPKGYAHPRLDKGHLGQLVDTVGNIRLGDKASRSKDILGHAYEYFLARFAIADGRKDCHSFTPPSVVHLLVEMLAPYKVLCATHPDAYMTIATAVGESHNCLETLKAKYPRYIEPRIIHVGFVHFEKSVYLKMIYADGNATLTDTAFISGWSDTDDYFFSRLRSPNENIDLLVNQFDPVSIITCFDFFTKAAAERISSEYEAERQLRAEEDAAQ